MGAVIVSRYNRFELDLVQGFANFKLACLVSQPAEIRINPHCYAKLVTMNDANLVRCCKQSLLKGVWSDGCVGFHSGRIIRCRSKKVMC